MLKIATRISPPAPTTNWLRALPPATRFILHGGPAVRTAAAPVWGVPFSEQACRALRHDARATLWLGPDEYLMLDAAEHLPATAMEVPTFAAESSEAAAGALEQVLAGLPHALVDVSHRQFALEVSGPHAATILSGACPLDLDLNVFPVDMCTRTVLAKADIVLWRSSEVAFHIEVWRSFSGYVTGLLSEIAREFYDT